MRKQSAIRTFLMVCAIVVCFGAGFVSTGGIKSCEAANCACGTACIFSNEFSDALSKLHTSAIQPAITETASQLTAHFSVAINRYLQDVYPQFPWTMRKLSYWFDTFWLYNLRPAYQAMARQLTVANAAQTHALASFADASHLIRIQKALEDQAIADHRALRPSGGVCTAATVMSGMTRASVFSRAYSVAAAAEALPRSLNAIDTPGEQDPARDMAVRIDRYVKRYCFRDTNNGFSCKEDAPFAGQDVDVAGQIFAKDTIDLKNPDVKTSIDDLITNLAEPFVPSPPATGAQKIIQRLTILDRLSYATRRQLVYDSLYHIVGRRAPGSVDPKAHDSDAPTLRDFLAQIRGETGNPDRTGLNPSYNEVFKTLINDRFDSGKYALRQLDEPENNQREMVIQQALQLMQLKDQIDLMDRYSLVLAAQVGDSIARKRTSAGGQDAVLK